MDTESRTHCTVAVTPEEVAATGDLFHEMLAASTPGPFFGPSHAGTSWSEYYNADGELGGGEQPETSTNTDYTITVGWQPQIGRGDLDVRVDYRAAPELC